MAEKNFIAVSVYVRPEIKQKLEEWAQEEDRSISKQAARIIEQAIAERDRQQSPN